jgi:hypothetical protein
MFSPGDIARSTLGVAAGISAAIAVYWLGAVIALLSMRGVPLGSAGGSPTPAELLLHLILAAIACFGGTMLALIVARRSPLAHAIVLGLLMGIGAIAGFGKPASNWPRWFGYGMGAACLLGASAAAQWRAHRR